MASRLESRARGSWPAAVQRIVLGASGGALTLYAIRRRRTLGGVFLAVAGGGLLLRSLTSAKRAVPEELHVERSVLIARPAADVYRAWRDVEALPQHLHHLVEVRQMEGNRSHWKAKLLAGAAVVDWDAELVEDKEGEVLAWRSLPDSPIEMRGEVRFEPAAGFDGAVLHVDIRYKPARAGLAKKAVAMVMNRAVVEEVKEDLRRFKAEFEAGEVPSIEGQPTGGGRKAVTFLDRIGGRP